MTTAVTSQPATASQLSAAWQALAMPEASLPTIHQLFAAVKVEVGPVGKTQRNEQQHFNYRGIDNVVNAAAAALDKYGVITIPELREEEHDTVEVGQKRSLMGYTRVKVAYHFFGPRGDEIVAVVPGEAMDSGDKAVSKAMSVAYRIALLQSLNLPTGDPDADASSYERSPRVSAGEAFDNAAPASPRNGHRDRGNGHGGNGQARRGPDHPAVPPLADDDPWKGKIDDLTTGDEANAAWEEIVGLRGKGTIDEARARRLQAVISAHMASLAAKAQFTEPDDSGQADSDPAQDSPPPARPQASRTAPGRPAGKGDDGAWLQDWRNRLAATSDEAGLSALQREIGPAITGRKIKPDTATILTAEVREHRSTLESNGAAR